MAGFTYIMLSRDSTHWPAAVRDRSYIASGCHLHSRQVLSQNWGSPGAHWMGTMRDSWKEALQFGLGP